MNRVDGARASLRRFQVQRRFTSGAAAWASVAFVALVPQANALAITGAERTSAGALATPALTLAVALAVVGAALGAVLAWIVVRSHRRLGEELRSTRSRIHTLDQLLDVWQWHSDASHRIISVRPPHGAPASDWSAAAQPEFVWELFRVDDTAALRARLDSAAPLDDIAVRRQATGGAACLGLLRARMVTDATGRFAGYLGIVREPSGAATPHGMQTVAPPRPATEVSAVTGQAVSADGAASTAPESEHESFSFTVSHDLRAPIRVVEGFTKIVKEDYGHLLDRVGVDHLDRVLGAAARMNNMVDALLGLSKLSSRPLARQPVNLSQLAGYVADDLRRQSPERAVRIEIEPGMQVQGDPTLLRVVIENLLGNAWKYTGRSAQPTVAFMRHPNGGDAFTVRDNGAGFDMRYAERLFGVFQRLHSANDFPGTGVGLASVRRIVRRHGGDIWAEAEVNRGAQFHFSLPQAVDPHRTGPQSSA